MDTNQTKARDRVLARFRIRRNAERLSKLTRAAEHLDADRTKMIGTIVCIVYAVVWMLGWTPDRWWTSDSMSIFDINSQPPIPDVFPPSPVVGKFVPWGFAGLFTFLAAPFMRTQGRTSQRISALAIFVLCAGGIWLVLRSILTLQAAISLGQATLWVIVPLGIAVWVLTGPRADPEIVRERDIPSAVVLLLGVLLLGVLVAAIALLVFA